MRKRKQKSAHANAVVFIETRVESGKGDFGGAGEADGGVAHLAVFNVDLCSPPRTHV